MWNTLGGDERWNLWVSDSGLDGQFVNGPSDANAGLSVSLHNGTYQYAVYAEANADIAQIGLNLFFNGNNATPGISVTAP